MKKALKVFLYTCAFMLIPVVVFAAEEAATTSSDLPASVLITKYAAAGGALAISAITAGVAQAKIGTAGAGTLAEKPEAGTTLIVLQALPEIIVLLGFVGALILGG
jgi:V/A-type H+-transporting ATPase subunit K